MPRSINPTWPSKHEVGTTNKTNMKMNKMWSRLLWIVMSLWLQSFNFQSNYWKDVPGWPAKLYTSWTTTTMMGRTNWTVPNRVCLNVYGTEQVFYNSKNLSPRTNLIWSRIYCAILITYCRYKASHACSNDP